MDNGFSASISIPNFYCFLNPMEENIGRSEIKRDPADIGILEWRGPLILRFDNITHGSPSRRVAMWPSIASLSLLLPV